MLARARTHTRACGCTYMFKAWTGEVEPLCPSAPSFFPSHNPPCLSIPPTSRLVHPPSRHPARPFFHSFSLYLSTTRGLPFLPLRLVRTIGVSTLETLHAWHTCKRTHKSTQYRYRYADTEKSALPPSSRKPVRTRHDLSLRARTTPRGKCISSLCLIVS